MTGRVASPRCRLGSNGWTFHACAPHALRTQTDAVPPLVFQEDGVPLPHEEQDPPLKVDGTLIPAREQGHLAVIGGEGHADGGDARP